jgi:hypothetical protein
MIYFCLDLKRDNILLSIPDLDNVIGDYLEKTESQKLIELSNGMVIWKSQPIPPPANLSIQEMDFRLVDFGSGMSIFTSVRKVIFNRVILQGVS